MDAENVCLLPEVGLSTPVCPASQDAKKSKNWRLARSFPELRERLNAPRSAARFVELEREPGAPEGKAPARTFAAATSKAMTDCMTTDAALMAEMSLRSQPASLGCLVFRSMERRGLPRVEMGFIAPRTTMGWPVVIPPSNPPDRFEER